MNSFISSSGRRLNAYAAFFYYDSAEISAAGWIVHDDRIADPAGRLGYGFEGNERQAVDYFHTNRVARAYFSRLLEGARQECLAGSDVAASNLAYYLPRGTKSRGRKWKPVEYHFFDLLGANEGSCWDRIFGDQTRPGHRDPDFGPNGCATLSIVYQPSSPDDRRFGRIRGGLIQSRQRKLETARRDRLAAVLEHFHGYARHVE